MVVKEGQWYQRNNIFGGVAGPWLADADKTWNIRGHWKVHFARKFLLIWTQQEWNK